MVNVVNVMVKEVTGALEEEAMAQIISYLATTARQIGMNLFPVSEETQLEEEVVLAIAARNPDIRPKMKVEPQFSKRIKIQAPKSQKRRKVTKHVLLLPSQKMAGTKDSGTQTSLKNASAKKTWRVLKPRTSWSRRSKTWRPPKNLTPPKSTQNETSRTSTLRILAQQPNTSTTLRNLRMMLQKNCNFSKKVTQTLKTEQK